MSENLDLISSLSEIFRTKIIRHFRLLKSETGSSISFHESRIDNDKRIMAAELLNEQQLQQFIRERPFSLVNFALTDIHITTKKLVTAEERRRNLITYKTRNWPPLCLWAEWIVQSTAFNWLITICLFINIIILGIQSFWPTDASQISDEMYYFIIFIDILDLFTIIIFVIEIILKWLYNFKDFWFNSWNVGDFLITAATIIFEIFKHVALATDKYNYGYNYDKYKNFRSLRSIKLITKFEVLRAVVSAIAIALRELFSIILLTVMFSTIYTFIGYIYFDYSSTQLKYDLKYPNGFVTLGESFKTVIQIFTNDHWLDVLNDITVVSGNGFISVLFVTSWFIIGTFFCQNIILSIIVSSFEKIVQQKEAELEEQTRLIKLKKARLVFSKIRDLDVGGLDEEENNESFESWPSLKATFSNTSNYLSNEKNDKLVREAFEKWKRYSKPEDKIKEEIVNKKEERNKYIYDREYDWRKLVYDNLPIMASELTHRHWPRDTLLRYYQVMENLMENIAERKAILKMIVETLQQVTDS